MIYTVHVGPRETEWPTAIATEPTRADAQRVCKAALAVSPDEWTKGEVRIGSGALRGILLDCYGKRPTGSILHCYSAKQRNHDE